MVACEHFSAMNKRQLRASHARELSLFLLFRRRLETGPELRSHEMFRPHTQTVADFSIAKIGHSRAARAR